MIAGGQVIERIVELARHAITWHATVANDRIDQGRVVPRHRHHTAAVYRVVVDGADVSARLHLGAKTRLGGGIRGLDRDPEHLDRDHCHGGYHRRQSRNSGPNRRKHLEQKYAREDGGEIERELKAPLLPVINLEESCEAEGGVSKSVDEQKRRGRLLP